MMSNEPFHQGSSTTTVQHGHFHLVITLLTLYAPNFEAYISKLDAAPSSLGLSCYGKTLVVIACVQWN